MKEIYKYGTGMSIPEGSIYLNTLVEYIGEDRFVWHYFLVDVKEVKK